MNQTSKAMRNGAVSLVGQVLSILLSFIGRKVFIQYLGVELLGMSSTFASILGTLSLAEMGFQQVIVFHLYSALAQRDQGRINSLVNIYKLAYQCIGCFFIFAAICCMPLLPYILSDIAVTNTVRICFLLQATGSACTYFLAYKRNILYADQNSYISGLIDMIINTTASIVSIAVILFTRNYVLYLTVSVTKTYLSNVLVHIVCTRMYPFLHKEKVDKTLLKKLLTNLKDVILERLAWYIYGSTDNLLISIFISTVQVGFLNNYTTIIAHIKTLIQSLTTPLVPAIGNIVATGRKEDQQMQTFRILEQGYFWLTGLAIVPVFVMSDYFVEIYFGHEFILPKRYLLLMCIDMYIHINQGACYNFLTANGLFQKRRNIETIGAVLNLMMSLILMHSWGITGILAGTAVSQVYYWATRSVVAFRDCLKQNGHTFAFYWMRQMLMLGIVIASSWLSGWVMQSLFIGNRFVTFIIGCVICELIFFVLAYFCCHGMDAERSFEHVIKRILFKRFTQHVRGKAER